MEDADGRGVVGAPEAALVNADHIRDQLDDLESQTLDLAEKLIMTIAAIRARLTLLEVAIGERDYFERKEER
jgi:hypothetical protein